MQGSLGVGELGSKGAGCGGAGELGTGEDKKKNNILDRIYWIYWMAGCWSIREGVRDVFPFLKDEFLRTFASSRTLRQASLPSVSSKPVSRISCPVVRPLQVWIVGCRGAV